MNGDAPPPRTLADHLTTALADRDDAVNALHDALNDAAPRLWWPLRVPAQDARLDLPEHALYAAHATLGLAVLGVVTPRRLRPALLVAGVVVTGLSWAIFTGAWDRRADQADS